MKRNELIDKKVSYENDIYKIIGVGGELDGQTYVHLASTTKGRQQKNGFYPNQLCGYVEDSILKTAS
jgi:hypothetical protein